MWPKYAVALRKVEHRFAGGNKLAVHIKGRLPIPLILISCRWNISCDFTSWESQSDQRVIFAVGWGRAGRGPIEDARA